MIKLLQTSQEKLLGMDLPQRDKWDCLGDYFAKSLRELNSINSEVAEFISNQMFGLLHQQIIVNEENVPLPAEN